VLVLLVATASADAAPAPLPKPPVSSGGFWEIDFSPLANADLAGADFLVIIRVEAANGHFQKLDLYVEDGKVRAGWTAGHPGRNESLSPFIGAAAFPALMLVATKHLEHAFVTRNGRIVAVPRVCGAAVAEVTITATGLDKKFLPIVKPPR
jgi:hypothetical protein